MGTDDRDRVPCWPPASSGSSCAVPAREPVHVRPVRPDGEWPEPARCPAGRRGGRSGSRAPLTRACTASRGDLAVGGIFLLLTTGLAVMMVTEPAKMFLTLSTAATVALAAAGTGASALWFFAVPSRLGLRLRFAPA